MRKSRSRSPNKFNQTEMRQRHQSISYIQDNQERDQLMEMQNQFMDQHLETHEDRKNPNTIIPVSSKAFEINTKKSSVKHKSPRKSLKNSRSPSTKSHAENPYMEQPDVERSKSLKTQNTLQNSDKNKNISPRSPNSHHSNKLNKQEMALLKNPQSKIVDDLVANTGGYASSVENLEQYDDS